MQTTIQEIATEFKRLTYMDQDQKNMSESLYSISLGDAMSFIGCEPITCLQCLPFMRMQDTYLRNPIFNFRYANSDTDPDGHYTYRTNPNCIEKLYFSITGLKYFSMIYPSPRLSIIIQYYINLESEYLGFSRDADKFM
jgi:hypothetical protein